MSYVDEYYEYCVGVGANKKIKREDHVGRTKLFIVLKINRF